INNSRQVVGTVQTAQGKRAFLWSSGKGLTLLPPLAGDDSSAASRINQAGIVAGTSTGPRGTHAVLWNASGDVRDLGTLPSGTYSAAYDISDSGEAVGVSDTSLGARAFLWTAQGGMLDLNSAIPADANVLLTAAQAINSRGQIVAIGTMNHDPSNDRPSDMDDNEHAGPIHLFLLTPVGLP
ncbi:MAG TPA: hypothetical protein VKT29_09280, partial [Terriglobales bacterium]|nr:hypothetical protein [Terriglobales bacterium]